VILRCTRKLLDVIRPGQLADAPADGDDWYANLLRIGGRKCLLLTHAGTLFTIFEPDVRAAGLRDTGRLITGLITRELEREGLPAGAFGDPDPASVLVAKTADRVILGCNPHRMPDHQQAGGDRRRLPIHPRHLWRGPAAGPTRPCLSRSFPPSAWDS
jgi:hypothetical protein